MQQLLTILHILAALAVVGLVLIQRGKGADMGMGSAYGGGASQTMFGSQGATPFLVKLTAGLAFVFFVTSSLLSFYINRTAPSNALLMPETGVPVQVEQAIPTELQKDTVQASQPGESKIILPPTTAPKLTPMPSQADDAVNDAHPQKAISPMPKSNEGV